MRKAVYPGTFDPITNGHIDIIERSSKLFDKVIVGVADVHYKTNLLTLEERFSLVQSQVNEYPNVEAKTFSGLLVDFIKKEEACVVIRGLRAVSDFEYEFQLSLMNKKLNADFETVFLMTSADYLFISSNIIKRVASLDGCVEGLVPKEVSQALRKKYGLE